MDKFFELLSDNSSPIWTLLSVIVGGIVTYISTTISETRKNKRQAQKEKVEEVLIPYCTSLEETVAKANNIYQTPTIFYENGTINEWLNDLRIPLKYLNAAKRVFLSKTAREKLQSYREKLNTFETELEQECSMVITKYYDFLQTKLQNFPNVLSPMYLTFSMSKGAEDKIKVAILNKKDLTLLDNLIAVDFIQNDDPDNYKCNSISLSKSNRETWGAIDYGAIDISDVTDPEIELACILLDFIHENIIDEKEQLSKIIDDTVSAENMRGIIDTLNEMVKEIIKMIDKVTK